jgi:hypothetical protein
MADCLAKDGTNDTVRRPLHQLPREASANAVTHEQELFDAEVVHEAKLIVGKRVPRVVGRNRAGGLAAIGVPLIHRDAAKFVLENLHGVEDCVRPVADARVQAAARHEEQRKTTASFLIADSDITFFVKRHGTFSQQKPRQLSLPG